MDPSNPLATPVAGRILAVDPEAVAARPRKLRERADRDVDEFIAKVRGWEVGVEVDTEPAALPALAARALTALKMSGASQSIIVRGDGLVDKHSVVTQLVNHINALSAKKTHKVHSRIAAAQFVLASLGNVQTTRCNNVNRFGHCTELQFDDKHKMIGAKILEFMLDKDRVTSVPTEERSYHIFYYLLAGAAPDQRTQWKLQADPAGFEYLRTGSKVLERSDSENFSKFLNALKTIGLSKKSQNHVLAVLAAILHLGQIQFIDAKNSDNEMAETRVRNRDALEHAATLLAVPAQALEDSLLSHTGYVGKDMCTIVHNTQQALAQTASLARTLYGLLFTWIVEFINSRVNSDNPAMVLSIVEFPGPQTVAPVTPQSPPAAGFWPTLANHIDARFDGFTAQYLHDLVNEFANEGVSTRAFNLPTPPANPDTRGIRRKFKDADLETISLDVIKLFRSSCTNEFIGGLFALKAIALAQDRRKLTHVPSKPLRKSSIKRSKSRRDEDNGASSADDGAVPDPSVTDELDSSITELLGDLAETNVFLVACGAPPATQTLVGPVVQQLQAALPNNGNFPLRMPLSRMITRYSGLMASHSIDESRSVRDRVDLLLRSVGVEDAVSGRDAVWLSWKGMTLLERDLKRFKEWKKQQKGDDGLSSQYTGVGNPMRRTAFDDGASYVSEDDTYQSDNNSMYDGFSVRNGYTKTDLHSVAHDVINRDAIDGFDPNIDVPRVVEKPKDSPSRRRWVIFAWCMTWWIPSFLLSCIGRMKDKNIQMAWREKVTLCILIFIFSCIMLFCIAIAGLIICPSRDLFSPNEMEYLSSEKKVLASAYGRVYDLLDLSAGAAQIPFHSKQSVAPYAGLDISMGFPRLPADYCPTLTKDKTLSLGDNGRNATAAMAIDSSHKNRLLREPNFAAQINGWLASKTFIKGYLAISEEAVGNGWNYETTLYRVIIDKWVYDLTGYYTNLKALQGAKSQRWLAFDFSGSATSTLKNIDDYIANKGHSGEFNLNNDETFMNLWNSNKDLRNCFAAMFTVAKLDERKTLKCMYADYILLAVSIVLCSVILFKFLAALQMRGGNETPEKMDKFIMIQIPCYTEDETAMSNTINSIAALKYDDKRKLMVIICDGMIVGRGNDRPTPRIVLDILGVDPALDPEPLSYQAIGDGSKQHNMGKVYSGLYEYEGHLVPYLVLVKVGKPNETNRPGNRGKRDSQMMLMRFLNHMHYDKPMSPLELEIRHHIQTIIGVDPKWYEYMLCIDSDTTVHEDSLTQLVAFCMTDQQIIGCCGETKLMNEKSSLITMIQVYEYFISHHLAKAFESLFGSVTCLPGCFSMYRIYSAAKNKPILCHDQIVTEYSDVRVNTLHKKNLLSLGEDRYLTTLMLKTFPQMKTKFTPAAICYTFAPESWAVLLSQRRRWINSTFHNLFELVWLEELCGFCCFSMRFIVLIDLVSTITQPATVMYLGYLIYLTVYAIMHDQSLNVVMISLILIAAMYGLQAIVFILKKEFSHVVWMLIYILAVPVFSFFIPLYAFWRQDDFSWGNTRVIVGDKGEKQAIREEDEYFDVSMIKHMTWDDYQAELNETRSQASHMTDMERERELREMHELQLLQQSLPSPGARPLSVGSSRSLYLAAAAAGGSPASMPASHMSLAAPAGGMPSDAELTYEIQRILRSADLMRITKKQVREELSALFGVDLTPRKEFINITIDATLRDIM
ncbi:hypothetical protein GGF32_009183 [Allomyces javanicus]|nr:hypothetical protein GGF32_009183 [Allomyces javanicus]